MGCTSSRSVTESQFVALEGYLAGSRRELNLRFKDRVTILHDQKTCVFEPRVRIQLKNYVLAIFQLQDRWWYAESHRTGKRGWIPKGNVAPVQSISTEPLVVCWFRFLPLLSSSEQ
jgi:hypothetical protein